MKERRRKFSFKIVVVGDGRVGKTTLIKKFTESSFIKDYIKTIGAQFSVFDKEMEGDQIRLLFWDIAGQDNFHFLRPSFFRSSKAAIIVYSLEENKLGEDSFNHISDWQQDVNHYCGNIPIVVFANKVDLIDENNINRSAIKEIVEKKSFFGYYITSAKTGQGVIKAFNAIINTLYKKNKGLSAEL
ncbi:MAG: Rab family GTPase [Promethearchaeota archaeon]